MRSLARIRHVALDLDGTLYVGETVLPATAGFLAELAELGIGWSFVTNNSSRSRAEYADKLARLGIDAGPDDVFTSTDAAVEVLRAEWPDVQRVWALAVPSVSDELRAAGFEPTADDARDVPDAVVVAYDKSLDYARLCRTAHWIAEGLPYVATHPDRVCPTDQATVLVDAGAICALLEAATGRGPDAIAGKPEPRMLRAICARHGCEPDEVAVVGDRLYTDIAMAEAAGAVGVLVLTGEARREDLVAGAPRPDLVLEDVGALGRSLRESRA